MTPRQARCDPEHIRHRRKLGLLAFVLTVAWLAAIGAWHVLRWLTLALVALARSLGL